MKVNRSSAERLSQAKLAPDGLLLIFETMAKVMADHGVGIATYVLDYQAKDDPVEPDDLIPVITLSLRPAHEPVTQLPPGPASD